MSTDAIIGAPADVRLRSRHVFAGRAAEQVVLAGAAFVLARELGPTAFAPVSILLVVNSLCVTASDLGLGVRLMRLPAGASLPSRSLLIVRVVNAVVAATAAVVGGFATHGDARVIAIGSGLVWMTSAEAFVRKAAALRWGAGGNVAAAEVVGSLLLLTAVVAAAAVESSAVWMVAGGLVAKHVAEAIVASPWRWAFGEAPREHDWAPVWVSQVLALAIANVDFLLVVVVLGDRALSLYVLAFRLSSAVPSQVAYVLARVGTVDLASTDREARQGRYDHYVTRLFVAGIGGLIAVVVAGPLVEWAMGAEWAGLGWSVGLLGLAVPWRMTLGVAGTLVVIEARADRLVRWELLRLLAVSGALLLAALIGYGVLVAVVVVAPVVAVVLYHRLAGSLAGVRPWAPLGPLAVATVVALGGGLVLGWRSLEAIG